MWGRPMDRSAIEKRVFGDRPLIGNAELTLIEAVQKQRFETWAKREVSREIYMGHSIDVPPGVFPPRPDSIGLAQNLDIQPRARVLDVGTGSGVLAVVAGERMGWLHGPKVG